VCLCGLLRVEQSSSNLQKFDVALTSCLQFATAERHSGERAKRASEQTAAAVAEATHQRMSDTAASERNERAIDAQQRATRQRTSEATASVRSMHSTSERAREPCVENDPAKY